MSTQHAPETVSVTIGGKKVTLPEGQHDFRSLKQALNTPDATSLIIKPVSGAAITLVENQGYNVVGGETITQSN